MTQVPDLSEPRIRRAAEALYALLPAHIRQRDLEEGGQSLRALFQVLGRASAEIDAEIDGFYDALFVETAAEDRLDSLAALVSSPVLRPMPEGSGGSRRALIANTLRYRRGKGTARVMEDVAADVIGLSAVAVEYYQRIARLAHLIDPRPDRPATVALRDGETAARAGRAFDMAARLIDLRPLSRASRGGPAGRHGLPALGLHMLRPVVPVFPAPDSDTPSAAQIAALPPMRPWPVGGTSHPGYFQLATQPGRALRLFNPDRRADSAGDRPGPVDLPDRLSRLALDRETAELRQALAEGRTPRLPARPWFDGKGEPFALYLRRDGETGFTRVPPEAIRIANLETAPLPAGTRPPASLAVTWWPKGAATASTAAAPIVCAFDPVTGRAIFSAPSGPDVVEVRVAYGSGTGRPLGAGPQDRAAADQLFEVRDADGLSHVIRWVDSAAPASGSAGDARRTVPDLASALAEIAALGQGKRSLILCTRSDLVAPASPASTFSLAIPPDSEVHLIAAEWRAPDTGPDAPPDPPLGFILRRERRLVVDAPLSVSRGAGPAGLAAGRLIVDGVEFTRGLTLGAGCLSDLTLAHVTLRNPGQPALTATGPIPNLRLTCQSAILGPVRLPDVSGDFSASDSLLAADEASGPVLDLPGMDADLCNVTLLGPSAMRALEGTNVLFAGQVQVTRRQTGCLRYSYAPHGSSLPRAFRCQPDLALAAAAEAKASSLTAPEEEAIRLSVQPVLMDTALDEPTLALLHPLCPSAIREGGENGAEMGVLSRAAWGIARANLQTLFTEFLPHALEGVVIDDSQSGAVALRRNRP